MWKKIDKNNVNSFLLALSKMRQTDIKLRSTLLNKLSNNTYNNELWLFSDGGSEVCMAVTIFSAKKIAKIWLLETSGDFDDKKMVELVTDKMNVICSEYDIVEMLYGVDGQPIDHESSLFDLLDEHYQKRRIY
tara:strand:+ start:199 stop:597 length:399 start_codon:yes stop_codon:yes gene_type:complete